MVERKSPPGLRGIGSALVVGLGISGRAAATRLLREGIEVTVNDVSTQGPVQEAAAELSELGAESALGHHDISLLAGVDLLVVSPGVSPRLSLLLEAQARGIPVWSEVELAWKLARGPVVAVTGTNGKTTTVSMIEWICNRAGRPALAAGNIGHPFVTAAEEAGEGTLLVVEVSSFQLSFTVEFRPTVAVLLNIAEDHFDWHSGMDEYVAAKSRMWMNQAGGDVVICNLDDDLCAQAASTAPSRVVYFSRHEDPAAAVYMSGERMLSRLPAATGGAHEPQEIMRAEELRLPGEHNLENAMAAAGVAISLGIDPGVAGRELASFQGLSHRLQFAGEVGGVRFYDDSKATNPHAALRALTAFREPLVVILGGRNKGLGFQELAEELERRGSRGEVRAVYLIGEAAREIDSAFEGARGRLDIRILPGLEEVFADLPRTVQPGDVVLLSPACASFDRYMDYKERGNHFQAMVEAYRVGGGAGG
jgi:UDP-N-acetylmuramoylalanine--D-glutamate ligase